MANNTNNNEEIKLLEDIKKLLMLQLIKGFKISSDEVGQALGVIAACNKGRYLLPALLHLVDRIGEHRGISLIRGLVEFERNRDILEYLAEVIIGIYNDIIFC